MADEQIERARKGAAILARWSNPNYAEGAQSIEAVCDRLVAAEAERDEKVGVERHKLVVASLVSERDEAQARADAAEAEVERVRSGAEKAIRDAVEELAARAEQHRVSSDRGDDNGDHVGITSYERGVAAGLESAAETVASLLDNPTGGAEWPSAIIVR